MSAFADIDLPLLLPAPFRWHDPKTGLVHHGAVIKFRSGDRYVVLCTPVLTARWVVMPPDHPAPITCFACLSAREP